MNGRHRNPHRPKWRFASAGVSRPRPPGPELDLVLPAVPVRPLAAYALGEPS